jgi:urate oxidase / 2-oxo-4-hydroxy-4-carboxy-5-ureidoimidazoline decarboxylase
VERFASGSKRNYYGKGDIIVYRLRRDSGLPASQNAVFGANVQLLVYGDAFWPTYTTGDNTGLIATDSMKNFVERETLGFTGDRLEEYCRYLGQKFVDRYPHVEGVQVSAAEIPYATETGVTFTPSGPEHATAQVELGSTGIIDVISGLSGFKLLRLSGSSFHGFVRDEYTTLPDLFNRPLYMWLDLEWRYTDHQAAFGPSATTACARRLVREVFESFESGSIQQVIYQIGTKLLDDLQEISEVHLEANNRTWDAVADRDPGLGVYTAPRPPYGCLGLTLRRLRPEGAANAASGNNQ